MQKEKRILSLLLALTIFLLSACISSPKTTPITLKELCATYISDYKVLEGDTEKGTAICVTAPDFRQLIDSLLESDSKTEITVQTLKKAIHSHSDLTKEYLFFVDDIEQSILEQAFFKQISSDFLVSAIETAEYIESEYVPDSNIELTPSQAEKNMVSYLKSENDNLLVSASNYNYINLIKNIKASPNALTYINMASQLYELSDTPTEETYMQMLASIIVIYDANNANRLSQENKISTTAFFTNNSVSLKEQKRHIISNITDYESLTSELQEKTSSVIDELVTLQEGDVKYTIISNFETVLQNYLKYNHILTSMEQSKNTNLKSAAVSLHSTLYDFITVYLNNYIDISKNNLENLNEFLFSDFSFQQFKKISTHEQESTTNITINYIENILSNIDLTKDSFHLEKAAELIAGDASSNGNNSFHTIIKIMALSDISSVLQDKTVELAKNFTKTSNDKKTIINNYITFSQYLTECRISGEYCFYRIISQNKALLSWAKKDSSAALDELYNTKVENILSIENLLLNINSSSQNIDASDLKNNSLKEDPINQPMPTDSVKNNGSHFVKYKNKVYYWEHYADSYMDGAIWGNYLENPNSVSNLVRIDEAGNKETVLTGNGFGEITIWNQTLYVQLSGSICSTGIDGNGFQDYGNGKFLALDETNGFLIYSLTDKILSLELKTGRTRMLAENAQFLILDQGTIYFKKIPEDTSQNTGSVFLGAVQSDGSNQRILVQTPAYETTLESDIYLEIPCIQIIGDDIYFSYGGVSGSGFQYQGGRIARIKKDGSHYELLAGEDSLVGEKFFVRQRNGSLELIYSGEGSHRFRGDRFLYYGDSLDMSMNLCKNLTTGTITSDNMVIWPIGKTFYKDQDVAIYKDLSGTATHLLTISDFHEIVSSVPIATMNSDYLYEIYNVAEIGPWIYYVATSGVHESESDLGWRFYYRHSLTYAYRKNTQTGQVTILYNY